MDSSLELKAKVTQIKLPTRRSLRLATEPTPIGPSASVKEGKSLEFIEASPKRKTKLTQILEDTTDKNQDVPAPSSSKSKKRKYEAAIIPVEESQKSSTPSPKKRQKTKVEPVYIIPEVEKKKSTFKGRLGYACLNTVLRNKKSASESVFCSRTCRIDSVKKNGIEFVKDLGRKNVEDLLTIIQWNEDNNIRFMRMSSEMFPYASHGIYGYSLSYCAPLLAQVGELAKKYGHRLTTHPGQFTQLGSPKAEVVKASVRELTYHCEMMDLMDLDADSVMIIHGGGMYGDKPAALERIKRTIQQVLPQNVRDRLVLENDEMCYNAEDLLPICEELDIPLVFDYHHDILFPSSISPSKIIERANVIWARRGIRPKQHLSEPRPGAITLMERRAHADRCESLPEDLPDDMDLMIEAKDKEQAVLQLYRMYGLQPVNYASLRPPDENQTKETKGRKSMKRAQTKAAKTKLDLPEEESELSSCDEDEREMVE